MITVSDTFMQTLRTSRSLVVKASVYPTGEGGVSIDVPVESGSVTIDRTQNVRRQLDLLIPDPAYYPKSPTDPLGVWGAEIQVWTGFQYGNGVQELVSEGIFRVDTLARDDPGGGVQVTGMDRSLQVQDELFTRPRKFPATDGVALIEQLIREVHGGALIDSSGLSASETIVKHTVQQDRWAEITRIAQVLGGEVFTDENGNWIIQDVPGSGDTPVWGVDAGPTGVLVSATNSSTRTGAFNAVVVTGQSKNGHQNPVYSIAKDLDPASPTYWNGLFGQVPTFYQSSHIKTQAHADRVSAARLRDITGVTRSVDFSAVPNPALDAGDVVTVTYADGTIEQHLCDALTVPLDTTTDMSSTTRVVSWV